MVVRRLYSGNVIVNDYVVPAVKCRDILMIVRRLLIIDYNIARIKTPDDHWYISTFNSRDYVIIDYSIARIKTPDDHWYISTLVPDVKCRDIPMVVRRLYSGNVIINDYVVLAVKCRDIPIQRRRTTIGISLHFTSGTT
jgi:hypothetical protein